MSSSDEAQANARLLAEVAAFVEQERDEADRQLHETWARALPEKLLKGQTQHFVRLERAEDSGMLWAWLGDGESRFREGDLLALHGGSPLENLFGRRFSFELEDDDRWLLRGEHVAEALDACSGGVCYADPDTIDLTPYHVRALNDIRTSAIGRDVVMPLLGGRLDVGFDERDMADGERAARAEGLNTQQARAVGVAFGAEQMACIQGPPGTGKTRVLAFIARLLTRRGERVLLTSHTHMAIHNALNKVHAQGVPCVKVSRDTQRKGLDEAMACCPSLGAWQERPTNGYVVGATPFATCNSRLEHCEFDTVIFDEASQVTVALALMAMRVGQRYVFIGDHKQLPPVALSRSVLSGESLSVFAKLTSRQAEHTAMLTETYRMNRWLAAWPSRVYYGNQLLSAGDNRERRLCLRAPPPPHLAAVFDPVASGVFIPTRDTSARASNARDAELVAELCEAAVNGGVALADIGIVTPYRAQGRAVRNALARRLGRDAARLVVADTVERMQGQERELIILSLATGDEVFLGAVAGFFFQPERLNVSITRPVSKLIVIGPELHEAPDSAEAPLREWIAQYVDLLRHLTRVEL